MTIIVIRLHIFNNFELYIIDVYLPFIDLLLYIILLYLYINH